MGRATQGVTLIGVEEGDTLSRVQRVVGSDSPEVLAAVGESAEGEANEASDGPEAAEESPSGDDAAAEGEAADE